MGNFWTLFKKNFIVWRRDTGCCCCQIGTSIFFGLLLVLIKILAAKNEIEKEKTFYLGDKTGKDAVFPVFKEPNANMSADLGPMLNTFLPSNETLTFFMKNCNFIPSEVSEKRAGGHVAIVNGDPAISASIEKLFEEGFGFKMLRFKDSDELKEYIEEDDYGYKIESNGMSNTICFAINFDNPKPADNKWSYALQFNTTGNPKKADIVDPNFPQEILFQQEDDSERWGAKYFENGVLLVQNLIDNLILKAVTSDKALISSRLIRMPTHSYVDKGLFRVTNGGQINSYVIFPILVIYLGLVYHMLKEKENKITANMRNMGMSLTPHYLSWYCFYLLVLLFCDLIWTIIVKLSFFVDSNFFLIYLLYLLPGLVLLSLAFLTSAFFTTAKPGVLLGIILFFVLYAASIGKMSVSAPSESIYNGFALSPFTGLDMAGSNMVLLESTNGYGFSWKHVGQTIQYFKYRTFIIVCLIETVIFLLLGLYLDQVWPSEIGVRKHPLFFLGITKSDGKPKDTNSVSNESRDGSQNGDAESKGLLDEGKYEKLSPIMVEKLKDSENVIRVEHVRKVYGNGKVAVKDVSFDMFDNQIFVLLGHNGAGKTTTISMISGLLAQTKGSMTICGHDTLTQYDKVKSILGVCPQLNPLYENMTCAEHLELYGNIKLKGQKKVTKDEIETILKDIDLFEKKDYPAGRLSGGQKRKLCIGIAFIGNSKVILLDEPTSGMDTFARRYLWEMIKKYKKDRIIILCTHYMDEADFLGDRFAIMSQGEVVICGTSLFLKQKYGVGYDLTIVKEHSDIPTDKIEQLVTSKVPSAIKTGDISMELKFRLPTEDSGLFEKLFEEIENNKASYGIQNFGVSLTTLEEVFLRAASGETEAKKDNAVSSDPNLQQQQIEAQNAKAAQEDDDNNFQLEDVRIKGTVKVFTMHFWAMCLKRLIYFKRDYKGLCCEIILPIIIITVGLSFTLIEFLKDPLVREFTPSNYFEDSVSIIGNVQGSAALMEKTNKLYDYIEKADDLDFQKRVKNATLEDFQTTLFNTDSPERPMSYFVNQIDPTNKVYQYSMFYNDTYVAGSIVGTSLMNSAILKDALGDENAEIRVIGRGLPRSKKQKSYEKSADGFIFVFNLALAFAFVPAGVALFIVKERENNAKHQQIVSGVNIIAYWLSNLLIDYLKYLIPAVYCGLALLIFDIQAFTENGGYSAVWLLMIFYGFSVISFTYITTFFFKSPSSAQVASFVFNFFAGFVLLVLCFAFRLIKSTKNITLIIPEMFFRLIPTFAVSWGMFQIPTTTVWQAFYSLGSEPSIWNFKYGMLKDLIYLILTPFIFMGIIFYIELRSRKVNLNDENAKALINTEAGDDDVQKERDIVAKEEDFAVKVQDFVKEYVMVSKKGCCGGKALLTKKVAAKGISFGVKRGECFGLLGTNGAGKTTTFKALSGEIVPTYGITKICGRDLSTEMQSIRHLIGYCPQFDTLLDNLTAREHLEMYCAIKGIPSNRREKMIVDALEQLNLKQFEHVQAGTYSGGNKRKLSVAIALLGNPPVILLDEPSSGMDPEARRFMWSVIGRVSTEKKYSSVILTTHSMEEAEALSTKLAIMVEGNIECIGSVQHLKSKYGKGFEIEIKFDDADDETLAHISSICSSLSTDGKYTIDQMKQCLQNLGLEKLQDQFKADGSLYALYNMATAEGSVEEKIWFSEAALHYAVKEFEMFIAKNLSPDMTLLESMNSFFRFKLPEGHQLSKIFGLLENNQKKLKIAQYSVKQATTEQIFLNFAKDNLHKE